MLYETSRLQSAIDTAQTLINNEFVRLFKVNLEKVFKLSAGSILTEEDCDNLTSTVGWYKALEDTCKELNLTGILDIYKELDYVDSDDLDGWFAKRIFERCT